MNQESVAKITDKNVSHVASLAKLPITAEQIKHITPQLEEVLALVSQINELDTAKVPQTNQVTQMTNVFRPDVIDRSRILSQSQVLTHAPRQYQGYFVVKATIDQSL